MTSVKPRTVKESLYWSYAGLAMAFASARHNEPVYQQTDFIVRNKTYYGLLRGNLNLGSLLKDEKEKLAHSDACCYCGKRLNKLNRTLDHLIPQFKGGQHSADNLVAACRPCNSSKKALDLLEWMAKKGEFPPLMLLRRYLKLAIRYCIENGLMDIPLDSTEGAGRNPASLFDEVGEQCEAASPGWPFAIGLIPHKFPNPDDLVGRVPAVDDQ